jgi:hypothetical protein
VKIIKYMSMFPIESSSHDKAACVQKKFFFEKKHEVSLVVHLHACSYDERKKLESSGRKGMEFIEDSMDPKAKEEHEDSKKERKSRIASYYTENHKTTSLV